MLDRRTAKVSRNDARALALIASDPDALEPVLGPLVTDLCDDDVEVTAFGPAPQGATAEWAARIGLAWHELDIGGEGFEPAGRVKGLAQLAGYLRKLAPRALVGVGVNGAVFAGLAGRLARLTRIVAVIDHLPPELGVVSGGRPSLRQRIRRETARRVLSIGLNRIDAAYFQRREDSQTLDSMRLLPGQLEVHVGRGVSVDLQSYPVRPLPAISGGIRFVAAGPLIASQGLREYCLAAVALCDHGVRANWNLLATEGRGPDAINPAELPGLGESVTLIPPATDITEAIADSHIFVLPAFGDTTPEVAVRALSVGRPLLAADVPAHRTLVDEPVNGLFFTPGDVNALADAMANCLKRPDLIASMSRASRAKAERLFGSQAMITSLRRILDLPPSRRPAAAHFAERDDARFARSDARTGTN